MRIFYAVSLWLFEVVFCQQYYYGYMLRNPGLHKSTAVSIEDCISQCIATGVCSAVSYFVFGNDCVKSMCNNLDLVEADSWISYLIGNPYLEGHNVPAVDFEWMMTDSCGPSNQGVTLGPQMTYTGVTFTASQSVLAGNTATFSGVYNSYAETQWNTVLNSELGRQSYSYSLWVNWAQLTPHAPIIEFFGNETRGLYLWYYKLFNGGSYQGTSCNLTLCNIGYSWIPENNNWYHLAFVYNGTVGSFAYFINAKQIYMSGRGTFIENRQVWNRIRFASSPFDPAGYLKGKIFCVKLYNMALSVQQIQNLANSCSSGKMRLSRQPKMTGFY